jgi:hypothetical protein
LAKLFSLLFVVAASRFLILKLFVMGALLIAKLVETSTTEPSRPLQLRFVFFMIVLFS